MPHEFTEWEYEPEPQPSAARTGGRPPAKPVGTDMLEPPAPSEARTRSNLLRIFAILILLGLAAAFILWRPPPRLKMQKGPHISPPPPPPTPVGVKSGALPFQNSPTPP